MSNKRNYKNINFNCKDDYLSALYSLISLTVQDLNRYKKYNSNLLAYLISLGENDKYIPNEVFEEWEDKIQNRSRSLLMDFVDEASTGFSYVMFRKIIKKTEYKLNDLDEGVEAHLRELRDVRNWSFHLAQSNFVACREMFMKSVTPEFQKYVMYQFNPIKIEKNISASVLLLWSLFYHTEKRIEIYDELFGCMIADMETLLGEKLNFIEVVNPRVEFWGNGTALAQLSMAMQKKKYDGSDESYEKITHMERNNW